MASLLNALKVPVYAPMWSTLLARLKRRLDRDTKTYYVEEAIRLCFWPCDSNNGSDSPNVRREILSKLGHHTPLSYFTEKHGSFIGDSLSIIITEDSHCLIALESREQTGHSFKLWLLRAKNEYTIFLAASNPMSARVSALSIQDNTGQLILYFWPINFLQQQKSRLSPCHCTAVF